MHINTLHKTATLVKLAGFPSNVLQLLCLSSVIH